MKAIIMAGGEGSRLRPLTCDCPKPMLRLMGKPLMEYAIGLLRKYDMTDIAATLGYLPDVITDYFGDGEDFGVNLSYFIEKTPLGTAGSVKMAAAPGHTHIILSGDGITDFDLKKALDFHRSRAAAATIVLKRSGTPQEYGMVVTDSNGRIQSFHEKPGRFDVYSDLINTGIYILEPEMIERIPQGRAYDFGHDLFPSLLAEGIELYGYISEGYWCDVGDVSAYLNVHSDAMDGKLHLEELLPTRPGEVSAKGAILDPGCILEAPCFIGAGAHIYAGAQIHPYTVIGENATVFPGADIKRSILFAGVRVDPHAQLRGCVIAKNASVCESAQVFEACVVGSGSVVGERAVLKPGVKLWPEKEIPGGERMDMNIVWGSRREHHFLSGALQLDSPAQAARAAEACAAEGKADEVLLGRNSSAVADAMWHAAAAGMMAQGVQVIDAGVCTLPQLRHAMSSLNAKAAMLVEEGALLPLNANGARLNEKRQRSILKLYERQDFPSPFGGITHPIISAGQTEIGYIAQLASRFEADPTLAQPLALCTQSDRLLHLAERACQRAGIKCRTEWDHEMMLLTRDEIGVFLTDSGESAVLADENGLLDEAYRQLLIAWTALELGETQLILPSGATHAIENLAELYHARVSYLACEPADWMSTLAEKSPLQFALQSDGLFLTFSALSIFTDRGISLAKWRAEMPQICRRTRSVHVPPTESGRILHILAEREPEAKLGGGVCFPKKGGWAWLCPDDAKPELRIVTESANVEFANELCNFYERELKKLMHTPSAPS